MGKTLTKFRNGWAGKVSRSNDQVIESFRNVSLGDIGFGVPVFWDSTNKGIIPYDSATCTMDNFVGFTVNIGDKSPENYSEDAGKFTTKDPVEVITRGCVVVDIGNYTAEGASVYIKKSDGTLTSSAGEAGTTVQITNAITRTARDSNHMIEIVLKNRNFM